MSSPDPMAGTTPAPSQPRKKRFGTYFASFLLVVIAAFALYTWFTLSWSYSEGERAGILQKFSKKGFLCKTYEGELALYIVGGMAPEIWKFTVRDETLAAQLAQSVGGSVRLHYEEHLGVPTSCFGDTGYYVQSFERIESPQAHAPIRVP
jgi:hypothetical protein